MQMRVGGTVSRHVICWRHRHQVVEGACICGQHCHGAMPPATTPHAAAIVQGTDNEQADCVQQAGIWALSVSNNFIGNRCVCARPSAWGANAGAVCTQDFIAQHDCCHSKGQHEFQAAVQPTSSIYCIWLFSGHNAADELRPAAFPIISKEVAHLETCTLA